MAVNNLYQPWRAIPSMINQCLTGKTSRKVPYYNAYLEMVSKHEQKIAAEKKGDEEQDRPESVPEPQGASEEYDLERAIQMNTEIGTDTNKTAELNEGQAGSDPGKTFESQPPPDDDKMDEDQAGSDPKKSHVALAGPNP
nr:hypothetical protein [Tanacetum cinerariifolium]